MLTYSAAVPESWRDTTPLAASTAVRGTSAWGLAAAGSARLPAGVRSRDSTQRAAARAPLAPPPRAAGPSVFDKCPAVDDLLKRQFPARLLTPTFTIGGVEYNALTRSSDLMRLQADADAAAAAPPPGAGGVIGAAEALAEARAALLDVPSRLLEGAGLYDAVAGRLRGLGLLLALVATAGLLADFLL